MDTPIVDLPAAARQPLADFDYHSNRLKLEYLAACCTHEFDPLVIAELGAYYGQDVLVAGGMNEAFRWFLGAPDVERIQALPGGEPFIEFLEARTGSGLLLRDHDPRPTATLRALQAACGQVREAFLAETGRQERLAILSEYFAIKVTCHDLFIHGRGEAPAKELFRTPYVHIQPDQAVAYVRQVRESGLDEFKLKNLLSYAMASGIDPLDCLLGTGPDDRRELRQELGQALRQLDGLDWELFFRWDIYGICNFLEGPVSLRRSRSRRCVDALQQAWRAYDWQGGTTATQASDFLARQAFEIVFDHSAVIRSSQYPHFLDAQVRAAYLAQAGEALERLDRLHARG